MSRYDRYTPGSIDLLNKMTDRVRRRGGSTAEPADLLETFAETETVEFAEFMEVNGLCWQSCDEPQRTEPTSPAPKGKVNLSADLRGVLDRAEALGPGQVTRYMLLAAMIPFIAGHPDPRLLTKATMRPAELGKTKVLQPDENLPATATPAASPAAATSSPTGGEFKILGKIAKDITGRPPRHPIIGRDAEIEALGRIVTKFFKPNAILVGDPGTGKTAIVEGFAEEIRSGRADPNLKGVRIFQMNAGDLVAGTGYYGTLQKKVAELIEDLENHPEIILFVDEIHSLMRETGGAVENPTDLLKPALGRAGVRCIGATTAHEFAEMKRKDEAFCRRFETIRVDEPGKESVLHLLAELAPAIAEHHKVEVDAAIFDRLYTLARTEINHRRFPDKALDLLDRALALAHAKGDSRLAEGHLRAVVAEVTGVPFTQDSPEMRDRLASLDQILRRDIFGQDDAIRRVANVIRLCKRRLDFNPRRPDGVFLLTGPSGTGKTEMARRIAEHLAGSPEALTRLDMSEYALDGQLTSLTGAGPSYVGYGEESPLVKGVRRHPNGVLLLDEFEKAHPAVQRFFLQVFDEGHFKDGTGQTHTISTVTVIATANLVPPDAKSGIGFAGGGPGRDHADHAFLLGRFPAELINRFDEIVVFRHLDRDDARRILRELLLPGFLKRVREETGKDIVISPEVEEQILRDGFARDLGVRHLQRAIQKAVMPLV